MNKKSLLKKNEHRNSISSNDGNCTSINSECVYRICKWLINCKED